MCERVFRVASELLQEIKASNLTSHSIQPNDVRVHRLFRSAAAFVTDIDICTLVVDTMEDLRNAYSNIQNDVATTIIQSANKFCSSWVDNTGWRDITVWFEVKEPFLVE